MLKQGTEQSSHFPQKIVRIAASWNGSEDELAEILQVCSSSATESCEMEKCITLFKTWKDQNKCEGRERDVLSHLFETKGYPAMSDIINSELN